MELIGTVLGLTLIAWMVLGDVRIARLSAKKRRAVRRFEIIEYKIDP